jgi:hypothetical protein
MRRFARFRRTELPTRRDATIPTCGGPLSARVRITLIPPERRVSPVRRTAANRAAGLSETNGRPWSGSEVPPALEATPLDHSSPGTGPHSIPEPVLPLASSHVGLVGTLHGEVSPRLEGRRATGRFWTGRFYADPASMPRDTTKARSSAADREIPPSSAKERCGRFLHESTAFPEATILSQLRQPFCTKAFEGSPVGLIAPYRWISPCCRRLGRTHILAAAHV